jgi:hypothetical protein
MHGDYPGLKGGEFYHPPRIAISGAIGHPKYCFRNSGLTPRQRDSFPARKTFAGKHLFITPLFQTTVSDFICQTIDLDQ